MMIHLKEVLIYFFGFIWILFGTHYFAQFFQRIKLPLITGFIVIGVFVGPYFLDLVPHEAIKNIQFINDFALAYIAFAAGAELYLKDLRSRLKSIAWNTFGQLVVTFVFSSVVVFHLLNTLLSASLMPQPALHSL